MSDSTKRWVYGAWVLLILASAAAHFVHLSADFPNHSPWINDWAKYTDEGWYGNAAMRAHLFGHWYMPGDFNPAVALPVWPFFEWLLFFATGVSLTAARAMSVSFFCVDLLLIYCLVRARAPRWAGLLAVTVAVTSPFLYAFSRLATLEPLLIAFTLAAFNVALRVPRMRRQVMVAASVGLLFTLMLLTKTSAVFLLPAIVWALLAPLWRERGQAIRCACAAASAAAGSYVAWMAVVVRAGLLRDYKYLFFINHYPKPHEWYWPALSFWWALRGTMWGGRVLIVAAAAVVLATFIFYRAHWSRALRSDPVFGASLLGAFGYLLFMTYQNHPQPRYYTVVAVFACVIVGLGAQGLVDFARQQGRLAFDLAKLPNGGRMPVLSTMFAGAALIVALSAVAVGNAVSTLSYVMHPEYTYVEAARRLTRYIDQHANGNRILVSISGDQITLMTHVPTLCDDFGTETLPSKIAQYQPGWWATWNDIDPGTLEDLHTRYSLEQVASFRAMDHHERNELVLFKLHPLPNGEVREFSKNLKLPLPDDKIEVDVE